LLELITLGRDILSIAQIAQLGERETEDLEVAGSIPALGILFSRKRKFRFYMLWSEKKAKLGQFWPFPIAKSQEEGFRRLYRMLEGWSIEETDGIDRVTGSGRLFVSVRIAQLGERKIEHL
jgi:hypothetical protein